MVPGAFCRHAPPLPRAAPATPCPSPCPSRPHARRRPPARRPARGLRRYRARSGRRHRLRHRHSRAPCPCRRPPGAVDRGSLFRPRSGPALWRRARPFRMRFDAADRRARAQARRRALGLRGRPRLSRARRRADRDPRHAPRPRSHRQPASGAPRRGRRRDGPVPAPDRRSRHERGADPLARGAAARHRHRRLPRRHRPAGLAADAGTQPPRPHRHHRRGVGS